MNPVGKREWDGIETEDANGTITLKERRNTSQRSGTKPFYFLFFRKRRRFIPKYLVRATHKREFFLKRLAIY